MSSKVVQSLPWRCLREDWAGQPVPWGSVRSQLGPMSPQVFSSLFNSLILRISRFQPQEKRGMLRAQDEGFLLCGSREECSVSALLREMGFPGRCNEPRGGAGLGRDRGWEHDQLWQGLGPAGLGRRESTACVPLERGRAEGGRQENQFPCRASLLKQAF